MRWEHRQAEYERVFQAYQTRQRIKQRLRAIEQELYRLLNDLLKQEQATTDALRSVHQLERRPLPTVSPAARRRRRERVQQRREYYLQRWEAERTTDKRISNLLFEKDVLIEKLAKQEALEQTIFNWLVAREQDRDVFSLFELRQLDYLRKAKDQTEKEANVLDAQLVFCTANQPEIIQLLSIMEATRQYWQNEGLPDFSRRRQELRELENRCAELLEKVLSFLRAPVNKPYISDRWEDLVTAIEWNSQQFVPSAQVQEILRLERQMEEVKRFLAEWGQWARLRVAERKLLLETYEAQRRYLLLRHQPLQKNQPEEDSKE